VRVNFADARRRGGSGPEKYYSIKAVAEALDVSPRTVRRWIAKGDLIAHRVPWSAHFARAARVP
jgi:Helix-turn-helix domain